MPRFCPATQDPRGNPRNDGGSRFAPNALANLKINENASGWRVDCYDDNAGHRYGIAVSAPTPEPDQRPQGIARAQLSDDRLARPSVQAWAWPGQLLPAQRRLIDLLTNGRCSCIDVFVVDVGRPG